MPGVPEHLIVRGINRQEIFHTDSDRIMFHRCLCGYAQKLGISIHAYVLMPNHVHLLATGITLRSISKLFAALGRKYVSYFNYVHKRTGTLWEGRFRSFPVQSERYLFTCQRYIEMNPVRAGIVAAPAEFPWSSHRFYAEDRPDDAVQPHRLYRGLGRDAQGRREAYLALFEQEMARETLNQIRHCVNYGWALGAGTFCDRLEKASGRPARPRMRGARKTSGDAVTPHPKII